MTRISHEFIALKKFIDIARIHGHESESSQGAMNRIPIAGNVYYQFGDLRVELPDFTIIVEVESSGGITNLAKYWECLDTGRLTKPVKLLHVYRQVSANDYKSHMEVWKFLCNKMHAAIPDKFEGKIATYEAGNIDSIDSACEIFKEWLVGRAT
ncbi:MAG: hypothetical protein RQ736_04600 [Thiogranum sp.]|nr:hypothetical protein [Thiogranum sp.]